MRKALATSLVLFAIITPSRAWADNDNNAHSLTASKRKEERAKLELFYQQQNPRTAPNRYWDALAKCETGNNWQNQGQWAGGLGIYQRTWYEFGGYDYARRPQDATRLQQIVIANRIALHGYIWRNRYRTWSDKVAHRGLVKYPVRYFGWGCAALHVGDPCGRTKTGERGDYRPTRTWAKRNCH